MSVEKIRCFLNTLNASFANFIPEPSLQAHIVVILALLRVQGSYEGRVVGNEAVSATNLAYANQAPLRCIGSDIPIGPIVKIFLNKETRICIDWLSRQV